MAAINDLISQIQDAELRERIQKEVNKLSKQKKFGLVFEDHMPECTPLYDMPIKRGCNVMLRDSKEDKSIYVVVKIEDDKAICVKRENQDEPITFALNDMVCIAEFGEPIYPYLKPLDSVCNAPDSDLWHTLIEADNYHALQLLEYLYAGKVDCIYIDPPYNTGAKDWKYNNDYVDGVDTYRHSKWLSFIEKRLVLAKKLLKPEGSVMIITIDEKEYLHLGCLLEQLFPEARIQMISSIISRKGIARVDEFSRTNEFIFCVRFGDCVIEKISDVKSVAGESEVHWQPFRRSSATNIRTSRPAQFYPIYINKKTHKIVSVGKAIAHSVNRFDVEQIDGCEAVFPVRDDGTEMLWGLTAEAFKARIEKGYVRIGKYSKDKPQQFVISYLTSGTIEDIENGKAKIKGYAEDGSIKAFYSEGKKAIPTTQWDEPSYDAKVYGTGINACFMPDRVFPFPKSLYAVEDCLRMFVLNKPDALIVDFFAGSCTTMHATMLLNHLDNGNRRCVCVTNNAVSEEEEKRFLECGLQPGDLEWEQYGIAKYCAWPRINAAITGISTTGEPVKGEYKFNEEFPMSSGFKTNAVFFKLGFLDKTAIALGINFKEMLPTLWMKAGCAGQCPTVDGDDIPPMIILPKNKMAILVNENAFAAFEEEVSKHPEIKTVFLATDYDVNYRAMAKNLNVEHTYQLYRDYLDHFRLNRGRN